jgi:hypothetical protein
MSCRALFHTACVCSFKEGIPEAELYADVWDVYWASRKPVRNPSSSSSSSSSSPPGSPRSSRASNGDDSAHSADEDGVDSADDGAAAADERRGDVVRLDANMGMGEESESNQL